MLAGRDQDRLRKRSGRQPRDVAFNGYAAGLYQGNIWSVKTDGTDLTLLTDNTGQGDITDDPSDSMPDWQVKTGLEPEPEPACTHLGNWG